MVTINVLCMSLNYIISKIIEERKPYRLYILLRSKVITGDVDD